ncbi:MAG TPA: hypothetical protein VHJ69_03445 [Gemmatimonadales bacterium]|jgi:hypothetical protein|nr:hypothetical protein [Gemmatimonadales bacterium]
MRNLVQLCVAGLAFITAPAFAQNRTVSGRGNGSLSMPQTAAIPLYHVNFNQSGRTLTLVFVGKNPALPITLEGRVTGTCFRGSGTLRDRGRTYRLYDATVRLRNNGEAEVSFDGQIRTGGRGRWNANGAVANISITEWDGRKANGSGSVTFSGSLPSRVNLSVQGRSITFSSTPQIQPR